jgi:hypothetical protein
MEVEQRDDNHWHFRLGPIERWLVIGGVMLLVTALGYIFTTTINQLATQGRQLQDIHTQQAVMNSQLLTLSQQLSDVPSITRQVAELQVQVQRNSSDIHELEAERSKP